MYLTVNFISNKLLSLCLNYSLNTLFSPIVNYYYTILLDVRTLVDNDDALHDGILEALEEYNTEQHITVKPPGFDYEVNVYFLLYSCCYYYKT
jgi:hypothetical protein